MAPAEWGDSGALIAAGWKYLVQRRILRRRAEPGDNVVVIWADEYAQFANSYDAQYLSQCRSHLGCHGRSDAIPSQLLHEHEGGDRASIRRTRY